MLKVVGDRVLIKPRDLEKKSKGGIILNYGDQENVYKMATQEGTIVDIGPEAYSEYKEPWVKVGDQVIFAQYSGKFVEDPETEEKYIVINDIDVQLVIVEANKDG